MDDVERSLKGTPALDEVERMRFENHTSTKGRSRQRTPTELYHENFGSINWDLE